MDVIGFSVFAKRDHLHPHPYLPRFLGGKLLELPKIKHTPKSKTMWLMAFWGLLTAMQDRTLLSLHHSREHSVATPGHSQDLPDILEIQLNKLQRHIYIFSSDTCTQVKNAPPGEISKTRSPHRQGESVKSGDWMMKGLVNPACYWV